MTADELLSSMSAAELTEWEAYFDGQPWPEERPDVGAAWIAAILAAVHRSADAEPATMWDFARPVGLNPEDRKRAELQQPQSLDEAQRLMAEIAGEMATGQKQTKKKIKKRR